jgi:hypothetical protein
MNEPTIAEILRALTPAETKYAVIEALPGALIVIVLSLVFSLLTYPVSMILAAFNRSFGFPEIPNWIYTALFLGIVLWLVRGQSGHIPILGAVAWLVLAFMLIPVVVVCVYAPDWAILPLILLEFTPIYLVAKLLEEGRKKMETGEI